MGPDWAAWKEQRWESDLAQHWGQRRVAELARDWGQWMEPETDSPNAMWTARRLVLRMDFHSALRMAPQLLLRSCSDTYWPDS